MYFFSEHLQICFDRILLSTTLILTHFLSDGFNGLRPSSSGSLYGVITRREMAQREVDGHTPVNCSIRY